jgi:DNA-binding IclR family transcriptional regulator
MNESGTVNAVQKSIDILKVLRDNGSSRVTDIADSLDLSKSSVHKHLKTLQAGGLVVKSDNRYRISYKVLGYIEPLENSKLYTLAELTIDKLGEETGELVVFAIQEQTKGVFIISRNDKYGFTKSLKGNQFYLHQNATGKAILAQCTNDEIQTIIDKEGLPTATENTIDDPARLLEDITETRKRGYATNEQERNEFQSVATGFVDPSSNIKAAISIGGPPKRLSMEALEDKYLDTLLGAVNELEIKLKYG